MLAMARCHPAAGEGERSCWCIKQAGDHIQLSEYYFQIKYKREAQRGQRLRLTFRTMPLTSKEGGQAY